MEAYYSRCIYSLRDVNHRRCIYSLSVEANVTNVMYGIWPTNRMVNQQPNNFAYLNSL